MKVGRFLRPFLLIRLIHVTCVPRLHTHGFWGGHEMLDYIYRPMPRHTTLSRRTGTRR